MTKPSLKAHTADMRKNYLLWRLASENVTFRGRPGCFHVLDFVTDRTQEIDKLVNSFRCYFQVTKNS